MAHKVEKVKRVWKPLDVGGKRLYQVRVQRIIEGQHYAMPNPYLVIADSPSNAAKILEELFEGEGWILTGSTVRVWMPKSWWNDGIPQAEGLNRR